MRRGTRRRGARRRRSTVAGVAALGALIGAACTPPGTDPGGGATGWRWTELPLDPITRSQGVATDPAAGPGGDVWYTSQFSLERATADGTSLGLTLSLPLDVLAVWRNSHTGDPDAVGGRVVVPWENKQLGPSNPPTKSFGVYDGADLHLIGWARHVLEPGEDADNPWVALTPDGTHVVDGRYAPMDALLVYPTPTAPFDDLPLVARIPIDVPPSQVQGCDMVDDTHLVCASNDPSTGKQVFTLRLDAPIGAGATTAHLTWRGALPQAEAIPAAGSACETSGEVEGIDARPLPGGGAEVRVMVIDRCPIVTHEYVRTVTADELD